MNLFTTISIMSATTNIILVVFLINKGWNNPLRRIWSGAAISIAIWNLGGGIFSTISKPQYELALFWWQISYTGIIFIPVFYAHFVFKFFDLKRKAFLTVIYTLAFIFLFLNWYDHSKLFLIDLKFMFSQFYWHDWTQSKSPSYLAFYVIFYGFLLGYAFFLMLFNFRKTTGLKRNQLKYFIFSSIIGWFGGESNFLPDFGIYVYPFINSLTAIYALLFAYAIIKYRLMDIRIALTRAGIFIFVYSFVLGLPFWLAFKKVPLVYTVFLMGILALFGPSVYNYLRRQAEDILLKEQRRYQKVLQELARTMTQIKDFSKLFKTIVIRVYQAMSPQFASIYSFSEKSNSYFLDYYYSYGGYRPCENIPADSTLVNSLSIAKKSQIIEGSGTFNLPDEVLAVPCFSEEKLFGFLLLGPKKQSALYAPSDLAVFDILSSQTSLAVENCIFWQEEKTRLAKEEQIRRRRAMDHFSASLAHEIDNPVFAISGTAEMVKTEITEKLKDCIPQEKINYLDDRLNRIVKDLFRISKMIKAVREFSSQTKGEQDKLTIEEILDGFSNIVEPQLKYEGIIFKKEIEPAITLNGNKIHLEEVLVNLATNAMHAVKNNNKKEKKINLKVYKNSPQTFRIEFKDNGYGIKHELLEDIFLDFVTTKDSTEGSGIGLGRVRQIIQNHGGKIWAESEGEGKGAAFIMQLPLIFS